MISPEVAWERVLAHLAPLPAGPDDLDQCLGRYLAAPVVADRDLPAAHRAAMDGYALRAADVPAAPTSLRLVGEVPAGSPARPPLGPGQCVRIFTGANVPPDADTVVMQEDTTTPDAATVAVLRVPRLGQHILSRGGQARAGGVLLPAGSVLGPGALALCATVGAGRPWVHRHPTVSVLATGSELRGVDEAVADYQIRDANGPLLVATLADHGFAAVTCQRVSDEPQALSTALTDSLQRCDVTLVSGGVSVGAYDLVPQILRQAGVTVHYHGVAMKPGKPQLFATTASGHSVFGLPGNPLAVTVGLHEFVLPALRRLSGCPAEACRPALWLPLLAPLAVDAGRRQYLPGRCVTAPGGTAVAPVAHTGSADLVASCGADGTLVMPVGAAALAAGDRVEFRPWRWR